MALAEDALKDWEKRYPRDPQLGRSYYLAISVEKKIWVQANQQQAWAYMNRVATVFPNTYFGKLIKREIAIGFTEHYYAAAVPCATPSPSPTPQPTAVPVSVATATPAPSTNRRRPAATPSPTRRHPDADGKPDAGTDADSVAGADAGCEGAEGPSSHAAVRRACHAQSAPDRDGGRHTDPRDRVPAAGRFAEPGERVTATVELFARDGRTEAATMT